MNTSFLLQHDTLGRDPRFALLAGALGSHHRQLDSADDFNRYCREACRLWDAQFDQHPIGHTSARFPELLARVQALDDGAFPTGWGGVVVTRHEHPRVEKYLLVRHGGYLALEKHELKDEHLEVQEGAGLILWRQSPGEPLTVEALTPGKSFHLPPGHEHCLIGTEDLLVFERSTDPKGMDQDLIFIFEPAASQGATKGQPTRPAILASALS